MARADFPLPPPSAYPPCHRGQADLPGRVRLSLCCRGNRGPTNQTEPRRFQTVGRFTGSPKAERAMRVSIAS